MKTVITTIVAAGIALAGSSSIMAMAHDMTDHKKVTKYSGCQCQCMHKNGNGNKVLKGRVVSESIDNGSGTIGIKLDN